MLKVKTFFLFVPFVVILLSGCAGKAVVEEDLIAYPPEPEEPRYYFQEVIFNSEAVVPESEESAIQRILVGEKRSFDRLGKPGDIIVRKGVIYLSDTVGSRVMVMDRPNSRVFSIKKIDGATNIRKPFSLQVDDEGIIYLVDGGHRKVLVFSPEGDFLREIGSPEFFDRPTGMDITPDGKILYVSDTGGVSSMNHRIRVFDAVTGEHLRDIGKRGSEPGEFNLPKTIKLDGKGNLYVNDSGNFRIQVLNAETGEPVKAFGKIGMGFGQFARPKGLAIGPTGIIHVADALLGNVQLFNEEGQLLMFIGQRADLNAPGNYLLPSGLAVDEDGRIYMVDQFFAKVDVFRPAHIGKYEGYFGVYDPDRTLEEVVVEDKAEERFKAELQPESVETPVQ